MSQHLELSIKDDEPGATNTGLCRFHTPLIALRGPARLTGKRTVNELLGVSAKVEQAATKLYLSW